MVLRPAGKVVYAIVDEDGKKKAQQRVIQAGAKKGGVIEMLAGLKDGETVALDGAGFLTNGATVAVKEPGRTEKKRPRHGEGGRRQARADAQMTLPELSIKRHVLAWMASAVLVLFGIIAFKRIGMDRFPYIEFPVVSITTVLKGANPDIVDSASPTSSRPR